MAKVGISNAPSRFMARKAKAAHVVGGKSEESNLPTDLPIFAQNVSPHRVLAEIGKPFSDRLRLCI
jgi:hypothetical protein